MGILQHTAALQGAQAVGILQYTAALQGAVGSWYPLIHPIKWSRPLSQPAATQQFHICAHLRFCLVVPFARVSDASPARPWTRAAKQLRTAHPWACARTFL